MASTLGIDSFIRRYRGDAESQPDDYRFLGPYLVALYDDFRHQLEHATSQIKRRVTERNQLSVGSQDVPDLMDDDSPILQDIRAQYTCAAKRAVLAAAQGEADAGIPVKAREAVFLNINDEIILDHITQEQLMNGERADDECGICTDRLRGKGRVVKLHACGHYLHHSCIGTWIDMNLKTRTGGFPRCPYCRGEIRIRRLFEH